MVVYTLELSREVSDIQMPGVAPVIFPEMYRIFIDTEVYRRNLCVAVVVVI